MPSSNWKQVKDVFHEALRRDTGERDAYLDRTCNGNIDLRIEVESLLIALADAKDFLEKPLISRPAEAPAAWQLKNDQIISHYRIIEPIGVGGMGEVYLAEDEKLHRRVAIKVLPKTKVGDAARLRRFKREAQAVSALNHPNILTIFDIDSIDDIHLFSSEFVRGETLRERLRRGPLAIAEVLEISIQVASALQAAHAAGVVHRDIKPENLMIRDDGYVKVLDFGLAKLTTDVVPDDASRIRSLAFSSPGVIMGTATYMSPEQARLRPIDGRTDVFSLGVVMYEMAAGRPPFCGETASDVIAAIIQSDPPPLGDAAGAFSPALERIIARALKKNAADRYQTAAELLDALKGLKRRVELGLHEDSANRSAGGPAEAGMSNRFTRSQRNIWLVSAVLAMLALLLLAYAYFFRAQP